jgi:hypothetical protein
MSEKIIINSSNDEYSYIPTSIMDEQQNTSSSSLLSTELRSDASTMPFAFRLIFGAFGYDTTRRHYSIIFVAFALCTAIVYGLEVVVLLPASLRQTPINQFFLWEQVVCDALTVFGMLGVVLGCRFGHRLTAKLSTIDVLSRSERVRVSATLIVICLCAVALVKVDM